MWIVINREPDRTRRNGREGDGSLLSMRSAGQQRGWLWCSLHPCPLASLAKWWLRWPCGAGLVGCTGPSARTIVTGSRPGVGAEWD